MITLFGHLSTFLLSFKTPLQIVLAHWLYGKWGMGWSSGWADDLPMG